MNYYRLQQNVPIDRQKGVAVIESVIVLPLVIFIILIVGELGHAILQYNTLTRAARDGARYIAGAAEANTGVIQLTAAKIAATENLVAYGDINTGTAVLPDFGIDNVSVELIAGTKNILVSVEYDYQPIFFPNIPTIMGISDTGGAFTMNAEIVMRIL
jgi:hypothetical protein